MNFELTGCQNTRYIYSWKSVGRNFKITVLNMFSLSYELLSVIFELTGRQNTRDMFLRIFGRKSLKSSFEQVSDELWGSKYDFWSHTVTKYTIIYVFEETVEKSLKSSFWQVSDELWVSKYDFWTHWVPKYKIHVFEENVGRNFKITVLNRFPLSYELLSVIFQLTGRQNTRDMFLRIFGRNILKPSFEQVSDDYELLSMIFELAWCQNEI